MSPPSFAVRSDIVSGNPPEESGVNYKLNIEERVWEALSSLQPGLQERVTAFWRDHLQTHPHHPPVNSVKRLRGEWSHYFQFDVDRSRRMLYRIDEQAKTVYVDYLGSHPEWERRGRW